MRPTHGDHESCEESPVKNEEPLYLILGDHKVSPCDHDTFSRFKLWVAKKLTGGKVERYQNEAVVIEHWDDEAQSRFPYLLNPCECGTYLPMEIEAGPMLSSAIGLIRELIHLNQFREEMEPAFRALLDALLEMAERSLETNIAMEIR